MKTLPPLTEFKPVYLEKAALDESAAEILWRRFGKVVRVEYPSPQTGNRWRLTAQGWCGYLLVSEELGLELRPKVAVQSVWRMLDYAHSTKIELFDDEFPCETVQELLERLAAELAKRVLDRARRGLYRAYVTDAGRLSCVRGRIDIARVMRSPWVPEPYCRYQTHTADIEDNRILTWTLERIARSGICHEPTEKHPAGALPRVRQAYRTLSGATRLQPYTGRSCRGRRYNRLNADYSVLHTLCRLFLDYLTPGHAQAQDEDNRMLPFLIPMDKLFEDYVAMWLHRHLPGSWKVTPQETYTLGESGQYFQIDIVLYNATMQAQAMQAQCVIDTKYKEPKNGRPSSSDIAQVVAYAVAKRCHEAVLLYPTQLSEPLDVRVEGIRVRTLTFALDQSPDTAGQRFLQELDFQDLGFQDSGFQAELDELDSAPMMQIPSASDTSTDGRLMASPSHSPSTLVSSTAGIYS